MFKKHKFGCRSYYPKNHQLPPLHPNYPPQASLNAFLLILPKTFWEKNVKIHVVLSFGYSI